MLFTHSSAASTTAYSHRHPSILLKKHHRSFLPTATSARTRNIVDRVTLRVLGEVDGVERGKASSKILHGEHQGKLKSFFNVFPEHHLQMEQPEFYSLMKQPAPLKNVKD